MTALPIREPEKRGRRKNIGFTLIELLLVISILGLLMQLLLPAIQSSREASRRIACANHLKQIGLATQAFHDTHGKLPPGRWRSSSPTWFVFLLPNLEATNAYELWSMKHNYYEVENQNAREIGVPIWYCPSRGIRSELLSSEDRPDAEGAVGDYAGSLGSSMVYRYDFHLDGTRHPANGLITTSAVWQQTQGLSHAEKQKWPWDSDVSFRKISDGLSRTILAGEKHIPFDKIGTFPDDSSLYNGDHVHTFGRAGGPSSSIAGPWDGCDEINGCKRFGSWHPGVCQFVFADGSVHPLAIDLSPEVLGQLCDRADGALLESGF